jgi:serralysin
VGDFTIIGGALTFRESPNYEMPADADGDNVYEVKVAATDADSNRGEKSVEVKVANEEEPGTVTLSAGQPRVGVSLTASLTDIDGGVSDLKWQWSKGGTAIVGATSDTYTPASEDLEAILTATASYIDAQGPEKMAGGEAANMVAADTRNEAPAFADQDEDTDGTQNTEAERTIAENADAGTALNGGAVAAMDPNDGDELTYTLGVANEGGFKIDAATGQITVGAKTKVNFEGEPTYTVTVTATDPAGLSAEIITVTINVSDDENEPPAITGTVPASFDEENEGPDASPLTELLVVEFMADDPNPDDITTITWSLGGPDAGDFTIEGGALTFRASPNYEMPADADGDNVYEVKVAATDADSNRGEKSVKVKVANVDELGTVTLSAVQPRVGVPLTASLTDSRDEAGL